MVGAKHVFDGLLQNQSAADVPGQRGREGGHIGRVDHVTLAELVYGEDGQPLVSTLLDCLVPTAPAAPPLEVAHLTSPSPRTALGSKGVGEAGTIGAQAAVVNALCDAIAPTGAELTSLPCSPRRIFEAVESARARGPAVDARARRRQRR